MNATLLDFVLPWVMAEVEDVVPVEPEGGIRAQSLRLGRWLSPDNFPWEVSLVRADWVQLPPEPEDGGPVPPGAEPVDLTTHVPCLLLVPRPLALPKGDLLAEFQRWRESVTTGQKSPGLATKPEDVRWVRADPPPEFLADVWAESIAHARAAGLLPEKRKARQAALKAVWDRTPWLFALSERLLRLAADEMRLPRLLDGTSRLLAARGARNTGWLSGDVPKRTKGAEVHWLRAGAYDVLLGNDAPKQLAAAFCDGSTSALAPINDSLTRGNHRAWEEDLQAGHNCSTLLPLPPDPAHCPLDDFTAWATRWLNDGGRQALWFTFGRAQGYFRWDGVDGLEADRARRGLRIYGRGGWEPTIEPTPEQDYIGFRCRWSPAPDDDATPTPSEPIST